jgi:transcriptional regulator with XRE-family HTH domain
MASNDQLLIGNNIRKWRIIKGFKQTAFAKLVGVSKATLSKIENDKQELTLPRLQKIAACLNIRTTELLTDPLDLLPRELTTAKDA